MKRIFVFVFGIFLLFSSFAQDSSHVFQLLDEETPSWRSVGPSGGNIQRMAMDTKNSNEIYALALCYPGQVFRTTDSGSHWLKLASLSDSLLDIAIDPSDSNNLYVLAGNGVYKSADRGAHWTKYVFGDNCYSDEGSIRIDPLRPNLIYASGYYYSSSGGRTCVAIFKSIDEGLHWTYTTIESSSTYGRGYCLAIDPRNPNVLYASVNYDNPSPRNGLFKSQNGGTSWTDITGSIGEHICGLAINPADTSKVYTGTEFAVYRSADGGQTWQRNSSGVRAHTLAIDSSNPNILYAGYGGTCYKSEDGGVNWITYYSSKPQGDCNSLLVSGNIVYFGSTAGVYKSTDSGVTWVANYSGIHAADVTLLTIAPSSPNTIYADVKNYGFYRSANFGESWDKLPQFYGCEGDGKIVDVHPSSPEIIFMIAPGQG